MNTSAKLENFLNECKGNLFEYLVGSYLARMYCIEDFYIKNLGTNFRELLSSYENHIRKKDKQLLKSLPELAQKTSELISKKINKKVRRIYLVGKTTGASHDQRYNEADLLLETNNEIIPFSLKLCKYKSFVNTKNAGVKSFFAKYFPYEFSLVLQEELNQVLNESYLSLMEQLYNMAQIPFYGKYDEQWKDRGFSELPGELNAEMRGAVFNHYFKIIGKIYSIMQELFMEDKTLFSKCLYPLLGFGDENIIQVSCFHGLSSKDKKKYDLKGLHLAHFEDINKNLQKIKISKLRKNLSSFEILLDNIILQIRVKPMNKFRAMGLKVNCSVKYLVS